MVRPASLMRTLRHPRTDFQSQIGRCVVGPSDVKQLSHYRNHNEDEDMKTVFAALLQDELGFIVSAELVLIATLLVIGLIVGLSEVQYAVVEELNDISDAIGSLNQSYYFSGFSACKPGGGLKSKVVGSAFIDTADTCDNNQCQIACDSPVPEGPKYGHGGHGY